MSAFEPSPTHVDYTGWECGGCGGELDPDDLCPGCYLEYALHCEAMYVDPYERSLEQLDSMEVPKVPEGLGEENQDV